MKETRIIMGMPISVELNNPVKKVEELKIIANKVFDYFNYIDQKFSTYKSDSEIMRINRNELSPSDYSTEMKEILRLTEETMRDTGGYFNIKNKKGILDPSGLVKGWAIYNASKIIKSSGIDDFIVEAGGDIQVGDNSKSGWSVGIRNPFNKNEVVKTVQLKNAGIATSGNYERGAHIYNPKNMDADLSEIVSLSVIGPNVYEADRFATAAYAMGRKGVEFIENLEGLEGYMIDKNGIATMTSEFEKFTIKEK